MKRSGRHPRVRQHGTTLMITLVMLTLILLLGSATAGLRLLDDHALRHHRAATQAHLAAQAALDDAFDDLRHGSRAAQLNQRAAFPRTVGCHASGGLCLGNTTRLAWNGPLDSAVAEKTFAPYGRFTGRRYAVAPEAPVPVPRYLIEWIAPAPGTRPPPRTQRYRLTALGFGPGDTRVALQAVVLRHAPADGAPVWRRLAWRPLS